MPQKLSDQQRTAILQLASGRPIHDVATHISVPSEEILTWFEHPEAKLIIKHLHRLSLLSARSTLMKGVVPAIRTLIELTDPKHPTGIRLRASNAIMNHLERIDRMFDTTEQAAASTKSAIEESTLNEIEQAWTELRRELDEAFVPAAIAAAPEAGAVAPPKQEPPKMPVRRGRQNPSYVAM